jgi:hypothetical protein
MAHRRPLRFLRKKGRASIPDLFYCPLLFSLLLPLLFPLLFSALHIKSPEDFSGQISSKPPDIPPSHLNHAPAHNKSA